MFTNRCLCCKSVGGEICTRRVEFIKFSFKHLLRGSGFNVRRRVVSQRYDFWGVCYISVTNLGINFMPAGGNWGKIAAWTCQVLEVQDDPCFSEPCENNANCTAITRDQYNCTCEPGYSGVNCETGKSYFS